MNKGDNMTRIKNETINEFEIEKSRFICYLNRAFSESEAREYILSIKKLHPNATHHCTAFIIGEHNEIQRSSDDGEPSGTAGVPMLECLKMNNMNDIVAVSVRYFGGIKLGAGGLIRAYSKSVSEAIKTATLMQTVNTQVYKITFRYDLIGKIDYYLSQHNVEILDKEYDQEVIYTYRTTENLETDLLEISSGSCKPIYIKDEIVEMEVKLK